MTVAIVKTEKASGVRRAVELLGGMHRFVSPGEEVVIKPNICAAKGSETGCVTDPEIVAEVARMVAECGGKVKVAESPIYPFKSRRAFERAGYADFESRYGFPIIDIDSLDGRKVAIPGGKAIQHSVIPDLILKCDKLINIPVMKTHLQTTVTLGLKNLKGVVIGRNKHVIHLNGLNEGIVDLNTIVRSDLTIIDGIVGMEGMGGPTNGRAVRMNVIVAGDNVVETDACGVRIMGGDPEKVAHIRMASERGLGSLSGFEILGDELDEVARSIDLPKTPGLNKAVMRTLIECWNVVLQLRSYIKGEKFRRKETVGELVIDHGICDGCRLCVTACPVGALSFDEELICDRKKCILCFCCAEVCPKGALSKKT